MVLGAAAATLAVGYAWVATGLRPFTLPSLVATLGGGLVAMTVGARLPRRSAPRRRTAAGGVWGWLALAVAVGVWELQSFVQNPRTQHPTLSSLTNSVLEGHVSRMAGLLAWLAGAVWLARR
jgi:hypothetical protein